MPSDAVAQHLLTAALLVPQQCLASPSQLPRAHSLAMSVCVWNIPLARSDQLSWPCSLSFLGTWLLQSTGHWNVLDFRRAPLSHIPNISESPIWFSQWMQSSAMYQLPRWKLTLSQLTSHHIQFEDNKEILNISCIIAVGFAQFRNIDREK